MTKMQDKAKKMMKNNKKADLDKDGKISSYEKRRSDAIAKNMKKNKNKTKTVTSIRG